VLAYFYNFGVPARRSGYSLQSFIFFQNEIKFLLSTHAIHY
jgi:hypothetical protein